jgi:preprotein translocase subunit SecA
MALPDAATLAALRGPGSDGTNGETPTGNGRLGAPLAGVSAGAAGSAAPIARNLPSGLNVRAVRESLGDEVVGEGQTSGALRPGYTPAGQRIGRNDQCFCGSGLKYKKCHGR